MSELAQVIAEHLPFLQSLTEEQASAGGSAEVWCAKEILGHLIDSGVNNQNRIVRAAMQNGLEFSGYDQREWVVLAGWEYREWADIVALWAAFQGHLAFLIGRLPPKSFHHSLRVGDQDMTLRFLVDDYVAHQLHHLAQIRERAI